MNKFGFHKGFQRFRCKQCGKTHSDIPQQPLDDMRIAPEKAYQVIHLLAEGTGIRACERLTGLNRRTILGILEVAGQGTQTALRIAMGMKRLSECEKGYRRWISPQNTENHKNKTMPGPVSDSYDPEFGTGANAHDVRTALTEVRDAIKQDTARATYGDSGDRPRGARQEGVR